MIGSSPRERAEGAGARDPRELDGGPPVDPKSPFLQPTAEARRRAARDGRPKRRLLRATLSWVMAIAMVAAAVYAGFWFTGYRIAGEGHVEIGSSVLTATTVRVPAPGNGQVTRALAQPSEEVEAGTPLFEVRIFGDDGSSRRRGLTEIVRAPIRGVVSSILRPPGSAVQTGEAMLELYDPASERFEAPVDATTLSRLRVGMSAELTAPGFSEPIAATVQHVVSSPPPSAAQDPVAEPTNPGTGVITLVLTPVAPSSVTDLIPGISFRTVVDTRSVSSEAPSLLETDPS